MIKTKINLTEYQLKKIRNAYEKQIPVTIHLSYKQISKKWWVWCTFNWNSKEKNRKNEELKKGVLLKLSYEQIKTGGFLPIVLAVLGALGGLAGGVAAITNAVKTAQHQSAEGEVKHHNKEMEKIAKNAKTLSIGIGLKAKKQKQKTK